MCCLKYDRKMKHDDYIFLYHQKTVNFSIQVNEKYITKIMILKNISFMFMKLARFGLLQFCCIYIAFQYWMEKGK